MRPLTQRVAVIGYGYTCSVCKEIGDIVSFQIWNGNNLLRVLNMCKNCLNLHDVEAEFTIDTGKSRERAEETKQKVRTSRELEQKLADATGGRRQPGSGNSKLAGFKGDIRKQGSWRMEHKYTDSMKSYTLHLADMAKIYGMAADAGELPALIIEFRKLNETFAVIPLSTLLEMLNETDND